MNQTFSFIYCSILLIAYTGALSFACCLYLIYRQRAVIPVIGLFTFFLLDNLIIFMTEQLPAFSNWYNRAFLASPSIKSVIYLGLGFFTLYAWNVVAGRKFSPLQGFILILLGLWLFFIPLMDRGSMEVWLYFLGYQFFSIATASYGLWKLRQLEPNDCAVSLRQVKALLICIIVLSLMIIGEDTFVIFNVDNYDVDYLDIFSRSVSEDILRIIFTAFCFVMFTKLFRRHPTAAPEAGPSREVTTAETPSSAALDYKRLKYAQHLGFTDREMEVFVLMLGNLNYQQISETLHISPGTAKTHAHNIFRKADVAHRYELIRQFEDFPADAPF
ncbi:MAG: LuxR C-terminal-related transcriptional regulator [Oscillospiraceae bacterium]